MLGPVCALATAIMAAAPAAKDLPFEQRLKDLAAGHPEVVDLSSIGTSRQGRKLHAVWLTDRGKAEVAPEDRPALVIVAGINSMHRVGTEVAIGLAEKLAADHPEFLKTASVYLIPCLHPDGLEWQLDASHPKTDYGRTLGPYDADHDGRVSEDPAEDLNGDGMITLMRVKDPKPGSGLRAEYTTDPDNPRVLKKPDASKGERAVYALLTEGIDNDGDGKFNEDGIGGTAGGGVDLDMNFPGRWPEFQDGAGRWATSEPETRALVRWMLDHKNIAAVLVYGPGDTLINIPPTGRYDATGQVPIGIEEGDKAEYEAVSKLFKEATNQTGAPTADMAGSFQAWAYDHYGVFSFETPVWVRPDLMKKEEPKKEEKKDGEKAGGDKKDGEQPAAGAPAANLSREEMRARMQRLQNATPEERAKMIAELPPEMQARARQFAERGGQGGGQGGAQPQGGQPAAAAAGGQPAGGPPAGGDRPGGGRGRRGGGGPGGPGGRGGGGGGGPEADGGKKPGEPSSDDGKWLKYNDDQVKAGGETGFVDWKPFDHPQLGPVEIGGFVPGFKLNPPEAELPRLVGEQAKFVEVLASRLPHVRVDDPVVERLGPGVWRITIREVNDGSMPTMPAIGVKARRALPNLITVDLPPERILAGDKVNRAWSLAGSGGSAEYSWMVTGEAGSTVGFKVRPTIGAARTLEVKLQEDGR